MKDTRKVISNRSSRGRGRAPLELSSEKEIPVPVLRGIAESSETNIEVQCRHIEGLIGEVLLLVDLLFVNHKVTVSPGGYRRAPLEFPLNESS